MSLWLQKYNDFLNKQKKKGKKLQKDARRDIGSRGELLRLLFELEGGEDGQVVADASLIDGTKVGTMWFVPSVGGIWFREEG